MRRIVVIVPCFNEQESLARLHDRVQAVAATLPDYRVDLLLVDDGSTDDTPRLMRELAAADPHVGYLVLSRNFGKEHAMAAGLDQTDADAVVLMDADLQDPPELLPEMVMLWEQGYEDVSARRRQRQGESWFKRSSAHLFYRLLHRVARVEIQVDTGDFRLLDRRCVEALRAYRETDRYTKGLFSLVGFRKAQVLYDRPGRFAGQSKWGYRALFDLASEGLTSFTTAPLRLATVLGMLISTAAFVYLIVIVVRTLIHGPDEAGYPSMMAVLLFLGGVQLLALGIIGEYLGRVFNETKRRPLYIVSDARLWGAPVRAAEGVPVISPREPSAVNTPSERPADTTTAGDVTDAGEESPTPDDIMAGDSITPVDEPPASR